MKATIDAKRLGELTHHVTRVLDQDHTAMTVKAADGRLMLEAVGTSTSRAWLDADVADEGTVVVPGVRFGLYVDAMPSGEVILSTTDEGLRMKCGRLDVRARLLEDGDMPERPQEPSDLYKVDADAFGPAVANAVGFAASGKNAQPKLTGVHLKAHDGSLTVEATDRYHAYSDRMGFDGPDFDVIVPTGRLKDIAAGASALAVSGGLLAVRGEGTFDMIPLIGERYVDLSVAFTPERLGCDGDAVFDRAELLAATKTLCRLAVDTPVARLDLGAEGMDMTMRQADQDVTQWVGAKVGRTASHSLDLAYLTDALNAVDSDEVRVEAGRNFRFVDKTHPGRLVVVAAHQGGRA